MQFLQSKFHKTKTLDDICDGLLLWEKISPFLVITKIEDIDDYKLKLQTFKNDLKKFYEIGGNSFLTKTPTDCGDDETFYMHCLCFYMPQIAEITLERHKLGLGIFTIQGFERQNKKSKNTMKRFSNCKGDILPQNLKRLWDVFYHSQNAM